MTRATMNTFTLPSSAAPRFRCLKMTRATTNTFPLHPAALVSVPYGVVLVRVRVRLKMIFTCSSFTCRPPLPLGLPHQQRASIIQIARDDEEAIDEEAFGGAGVGGSWGQVTGGSGTHVLMLSLDLARGRTYLFLLPERLRSSRLYMLASRVDRHCHWACRTNKGLQTFKERLARR